MPFIDTRVSVKASKEQIEEIKTRYGEAFPIINKSESHLMCGFTDDYTLFFAGEKVEKGAIVLVDVFGEVHPAAGDLTAEICRILKEVLDIPGDKVYVEYRGIKDWGFNGRNF